MTLDGPAPVPPLDALAAPLSAAQTAAHPAAQPSNDSAGFRRLLESLEQLAREHRAAAPLADAGAVQEAMQKADQGFTLAMDLRRQLEEAFRQRQP